MCVCVCVCARMHARLHMIVSFYVHVHMHTYARAWVIAKRAPSTLNPKPATKPKHARSMDSLK